MRIDKELLFSDAQAITADAASTNIVDCVSTADIGAGRPVQLCLVIDEAFNTLTSLNIKLQTDDNSSFSSATDLFIVNKALAALTLNAKIDLPAIPAGCERYLRMYYDVVGTDPTTGKITCFITTGDQKNTPTSDD